MKTIDRRFFLKTTSGMFIASCFSSFTPLYAGDTKRNELLFQVILKSGTHAIVFFNLDTQQATTVSIPYEIHGILPIREGREFLLTSKGAYIFHINREGIISSRRCPDDQMFYGHSCFREKDGIVFTSTIDHKGYDFVPRRFQTSNFPEDKNFGRGKVTEFELNDLKIKSSFLSGGFFPHDLRLLETNEILILNSKRADKPDRGGVASLIDPLSGKISKHISLEDKDGFCPLAHMFGPNDHLVMVGISGEASLILMQKGSMRKTALDSHVQIKYKHGEMLNAAFSPYMSHICAMNVDNSFLGLWETASGKMIKHTYLPGVLCVDGYNDYYVATTVSGLQYYDLNLSPKKFIPINEIRQDLSRCVGPHNKLLRT